MIHFTSEVHADSSAGISGIIHILVVPFHLPTRGLSSLWFSPGVPASVHLVHISWTSGGIWGCWPAGGVLVSCDTTVVVTPAVATTSAAAYRAFLIFIRCLLVCL